MKLCVLFALIFSLVLLIAVSALTQTLEDAQQAAEQMGHSGKMALRGENNGTTMYNGEGLSLWYGGAIPGSRAIRTKADSELNRDRRRVSSEAEAVDRARAFIARNGEALEIAQLKEPLSVAVSSKSGNDYSGWEVVLRAVDNGHKSLPVYNVAVDNSGGVVSLLYIPLANEVPAEAKLTLDKARDILLRQVNVTGQFTYREGELAVVPDHKGGCALAWELTLDPVDSAQLSVKGVVDASTGAVLASGKSGGRIGPTAPVVAPARVAAAPSLRPVAYALAALAVLMVIFLVVKLRKR